MKVGGGGMTEKGLVAYWKLQIVEPRPDVTKTMN